MLKKLTPVLFFFAVLGTSVVCAQVEQPSEMTKEEKLVLLEGVALGNELIKNALETGNVELIEQLQSDEQEIEEANNVAFAKKMVLSIAGVTAVCGLAALGYWKYRNSNSGSGFPKFKDVVAKAKALFARNNKVQEEVTPAQTETTAQNEIPAPAQTEALAQEETPAPASTEASVQNETSAPAELAA